MNWRNWKNYFRSSRVFYLTIGFSAGVVANTNDIFTSLVGSLIASSIVISITSDLSKKDEVIRNLIDATAGAIIGVTATYIIFYIYMCYFGEILWQLK